MKISASIYSNPNKTIEDLILELDSCHVDYFHVDCNDDLSVFDDIKRIRKISKTPIDLHIITDDPNKYFELIRIHQVEVVCFQIENVNFNLNVPKNINSKIGLAVVNETSIEKVSPFFKNDDFSFILLMTTTPGQSGGSFNEETYDRIKEFQELYPSKAIHVDGGVNNVIASKLRKLGVNCSISGSYLVKSMRISEKMLQLKSDLDQLTHSVVDLMIPIYSLPILNLCDLSIENVIKKISKYQLAFCLIVDDNNKLKGVITDGDLRRELLNKINDLNKVNINEMINTNPIYIEDNKTVDDAFMKIDESKKRVMFLPILTLEREIRGVLSISQILNQNI